MPDDTFALDWHQAKAPIQRYPGKTRVSRSRNVYPLKYTLGPLLAHAQIYIDAAVLLPLQYRQSSTGLKSETKINQANQLFNFFHCDGGRVTGRDRATGGRSGLVGISE